jgi:hypothetical protein
MVDFIFKMHNGYSLIFEFKKATEIVTFSIRQRLTYGIGVKNPFSQYKSLESP